MENNDRYIIRGGRRTEGELEVYSAKNCVLALMAAAVLCDGVTVIHKCPAITDVVNMKMILEYLGCKTAWDGGSLTINSSSILTHEIPAGFAKELRGSIFMMGAVLGRLKKACVPLPGGCAIGLRPINLHVQGFRAMNVDVDEGDGFVYCNGAAMCGGRVNLSIASVGATENIILAAALTKGTTVISNAAREPEIVALQDFLNAAGAKINGAGTSVVVIEGVNKLRGTSVTPIPDRIVAGTYAVAAALTSGEIVIKNCNTEHISALLNRLNGVSCTVRREKADVVVVKGYKHPRAVGVIETMPYPAFPTDLQAPVTALASVSSGTSIIRENMFETRFNHVCDLQKMGADITVKDRLAVIKGVKELHGAVVGALDLRGGAALVLAALAAKGETIIENIRFIDRGYLSLENELRKIGADIRRVKHPFPPPFASR